MEKSNVKLTKIPIEYLLEILETLYNEGYDYFDLEGIIDPDKEKDTIKITVSEDYLTEEDENKLDDYEQLL
jgi:hypothetical protein